MVENQSNVQSYDYSWRSLAVFIAFALIGLSLVIFKSYLDGYQQFYLRIFIGLSASGIAAIIPGFFEIKLLWFSNTIRASGAIAIFLLIYTQNPPQIETFETMEDLRGMWYYDVHPSTTVLGYGSAHYGGTANFQTEINKFGKNLSVTGVLEWKYVDDSLISVPPSNGWTTISGGVTADDKVIYQYQAFDYGKLINGFCNFNIVRNHDNNIVELYGHFYRIDSPYVKGTIYMRRDKPYYDRIKQIVPIKMQKPLE